ncbi:MAG: endonuclease domain-containing protein [Bacteroidales bacterium]|nr:endonuclease domain-containing protein [Bacteroidales bacterium]MCF8403324.1 endonuclease domain-containing protein [Bacteroidales bacterium]
MLYDEDRDKFMIEQGFRIIRFTNQEVYNHIDGVLEEIKQSFL